MGKERIKRILRLCRFEIFDKGEGRHKRIQAVSPLFFWKREKIVEGSFQATEAVVAATESDGAAVAS